MMASQGLQLAILLMLACSLCTLHVAKAKTLQVPCPPLTKELLASKAKDNVVLVTVVDQIVMKKFGYSFVENVKRANISYWFVAALDPWTSLHLGSMGEEVRSHCFNAPMDKLNYKGQETEYRWGSMHWQMQTWNKVHVMAAVYEMGFHVLHSDTDTTWFADPYPYFKRLVLDAPVHATFSTDSLETRNKKGAIELEHNTNAHVNINTGIYFVKQYPEGNAFFKTWRQIQALDLGHDQDGLNTLVRGQFFRGDKKYPRALMKGTYVECALHNKTLVSLLPVSSFGNAYTYVVGHTHQVMDHPLYEVHWVWSGGTMESKQQLMRETKLFWDPPHYYGVDDQNLQLVTIGPLWRPKMPDGFNSMPFEKTEEMILFHILAADIQLQQAYFGFVAAMALNRTLVMPRFDCFCAKNWYMTESCRINGEKHTQFPYHCGLSHVMRAKKLITNGLQVADGENTREMHIREYSFMEHPRVPEEITKSRIELIPSEQPRPVGSIPLDFSTLKAETMADGTAHLVVPWPLNDEELRGVVNSVDKKYRVIHLANATQIMGRGFQSSQFGSNFDVALQKMVTYWCCRSPKDQKALNATDKIQLGILPTKPLWSSTDGLLPS